MYLISILHALFVVCTWLVLRLAIRRQGLTALSLGGGTFFAVSTVGLVFSHYIDYKAALPFSDDQGMVVYQQLQSIYFRQAASHWILMTTICAVLLVGKRPQIDVRRWAILGPHGWTVFLSLLAGAFYVRYFLVENGLTTMLETRLAYFSAEDAVAARTVAKDNLYGQGAYMAAVAAYILIPVLYARTIIRSRTTSPKGIRHWLITAIFMSMSFAYAFQTRQKAPMLQVIIVYTLLSMCRPGSALGAAAPKKRVFLALGAFFVAAVSLYVIVFNMSITESVYSTFARIFMVPTATEANYFYLFPDRMDFRGFLETFVIRIFNPPGVDGVTIYDVAIAATGNQFTANASFLAVGWSGSGYLGVLLVATAFCLSLFLVDCIIKNQERPLRNAALALTFPSILTINSGSFLDFIGSGGIFGAALLVLCTQRNSPRSYIRRAYASETIAPPAR